MIIELLLSSCLIQQEAPQRPPPGNIAPPASTPAPPSAESPATLPPPSADVVPSVRTPVPPRAARAAQVAPGAPVPPSIPHGQYSPQAVPARRLQGAPGDYYGVTTAGVAGADVAAVYGLARRAMDPKEAELDRKARETAVSMSREQDPVKKAQIKATLQALVVEQFQIRQQRRADEVKRLEDEVRRLRDALEKREKSKDAIISRRIAELTGEDDLGF